MSGMRSYNPEQIMLSAAVRRSSRDLNVMKEKLIFSGEACVLCWMGCFWCVCFWAPDLENEFLYFNGLKKEKHSYI